MARSTHSVRRGFSPIVVASALAAAVFLLLWGGTLPLSLGFAPVSHRTTRSSRRHQGFTADRAPVDAPSLDTGTTLHYRTDNEDAELPGKSTVESSLAWTTWNVALNIGREMGTWMPESWGAPGARLPLQLQVQFRPYSLYQRLAENQDDFLGGPDEEAHICHVVGGGFVTLGPSATESGRRIYADNGGWRIARGEGPGGSDELRFFVELGKQVERGDVYCPSGRLYCTCGFFDMNQRGRIRQAYAQETLDSLGKYSDLLRQASKEDPMSLKRMGLWMDTMKCKVDIDRSSREARRELNGLHAIEPPDMSLLSLNHEGNIGLTRNGHVSCKVQTGPFGLGSDYYTLGRMELKQCKL